MVPSLAQEKGWWRAGACHMSLRSTEHCRDSVLWSIGRIQELTALIYAGAMSAPRAGQNPDGQRWLKPPVPHRPLDCACWKRSTESQPVAAVHSLSWNMMDTLQMPKMNR
ncbi:hypothetical protein KIL84_008988 [Mauremys mutica]|uniref:Uncharacterized protein n=1 Tax=Mauremys mutica TaxID=74926 RepID=A0A9D3XI58_9SAUR|nr:hypothetical protein KIL84_008988 [Mauremys mutica]